MDALRKLDEEFNTAQTSIDDIQGLLPFMVRASAKSKGRLKCL